MHIFVGWILFMDISYCCVNFELLCILLCECFHCVNKATSKCYCILNFTFLVSLISRWSFVQCVAWKERRRWQIWVAAAVAGKRFLLKNTLTVRATCHQPRVSSFSSELTFHCFSSGSNTCAELKRNFIKELLHLSSFSSVLWWVFIFHTLFIQANIGSYSDHLLLLRGVFWLKNYVHRKSRGCYTILGFIRIGCFDLDHQGPLWVWHVAKNAGLSSKQGTRTSHHLTVRLM